MLELLHAIQCIGIFLSEATQYVSSRETVVLGFQRLMNTEQSRTIKSVLGSLTTLAAELFTVHDFVELSDLLGCAAPMAYSSAHQFP